MLRWEQQIGYVLAGVAAAGSVAIAVNGQRILLFAAMGLAATVLLTLAVRHGQRIIAAVAALLAGLAFFYSAPLQLAFLFFSGYLMMRTQSAQGKIRRSQPPMTAAERRAAAQARAAARSRRRHGSAEEATTTAKTPPPNRRYTPPKAKQTRRR